MKLSKLVGFCTVEIKTPTIRKKAEFRRDERDAL